MKKKPTIAFSQRIDEVNNRNEIRDSIDQKFISWLLKLGCIPSPIPNLNNSDIQEWLCAIEPEGFVFSGGNDIGSYPIRDGLEITLIKYAIEKKLPVLGICRGMQIMAYYENKFLKLVSNHIKTRHELIGREVFLGMLPNEVNSYHQYSLNACPENYEVIANSSDGEIEAIRHIKYNWEGWMWHPERELNFSEIDINRARKVLNIKV